MDNPLTNHSPLFVKNFRAKAGTHIFDISGIYWNGQSYMIRQKENTWVNAKACTLIARPIEDMTVKEVSQINEDQFYGTTYQQVIRELKTVHENMRLDHALYLLSIGVYAFDQSHFGKTVIDSRTI